MAPVEDTDAQQALAIPAAPPQPAPRLGALKDSEIDDWADNVDEVSAQIRGIIDGTITDFDAFDKEQNLKERAKEIRQEDLRIRRERFFLNGTEGKGEGKRYKHWCRRCFVEYLIDLPGGKCTRCQQDDKMVTQPERHEELMGKLDDYKKTRVRHQWRKDTWLRWKKSQKLLGRSRNINYKAWEYWEPETDSEDEGDPIVPKDSPEFAAMEADIKDRHKKQAEKSKTAEKCRLRGNQCMKEGDFVGAIEHYDEGIEYKRDKKELWTNKALAELKVFRWADAIASCNKVIEYTEIFEEGFSKSADSCFKAFTRRAVALRALHKWAEALEDLEDALKLFPKDKEARDLFDKTKAALEEDRLARRARGEPEDTTQPSAGAAEPAEPAEPAGPVRIEIEESSGDEADEEAEDTEPAAAQPGSLAGLSRKDFGTLLAKLRRDPAERVKFCARGSSSSLPSRKKEDTRKVSLQVEEVAEPSRLDGVLKDAERCCVLWKKNRGHVVPLREDVVLTGADSLRNAREEREADAFVQAAVPRVLSVLLALASGSDHHCALTAPGVRHVWPLLAVEEWRQTTLELICEWSQRAISARALAEFAARYPEHLRLLLEPATQATRENLQPPGFESRAKKAAQLLERGERTVDEAMESVFEGLQVQSPAELAVSALGNICLAGQGNPAFREKMAPLCDELVGGLRQHLRPMSWRLCGRTAGALCNIVRLGADFAEAVQEKCLPALIEALKEEHGGDENKDRRDVLKQLKAQGPGGMPSPFTGTCSARLLGALVNLLVVQPVSAAQALELGALELCVPLIDPDAAVESATAPTSSDEEGGAGVVAARAALVVSRLLSTDPARLPLAVEADLLRRLDRILRKPHCVAAAKTLTAEGGSEDAAALRDMEQAELTVRLLTLVVTKTPGALDRLTAAAPRCEELPDDAEDAPALPEAAVPFLPLVAQLMKVASAARPRDHVEGSQEASAISRLRGNLALLFAHLCAGQSSDDAPSALRDLDLSPLVDTFVGCLRKERGAVQNNIGVCVTRLAQNPRYRQKVRDLNGIESLHQIQLPKVEAQKAELAKQHRIETSVSAKQTEAKRRIELKELKGK
jgi:tetratricopeptide (TPR) repeat protein